MTTALEHGTAVAAATTTIRSWLAGEPFGLHVTARPLERARVGVNGDSVNLLLYREELATYREGGSSPQQSNLVAQLHYLVSVHAGDATNDSVPAGQAIFGTVRGAVHDHPVHTLALPGRSVQLRLQAEPLSIAELTSLWVACGVAMQLSFGLSASFVLPVRRNLVGVTLDDVVGLPPGSIVVFTGPDSAAKEQAAQSVAEGRQTRVVRISLDEIVSPYFEQTEANLARALAQAESAQAVLVLDEADALFGGRTDAPDQRERYAGVDVQALLERLSRSAGLVILALVGDTGTEVENWSGALLRFPPDE